MMILFKAVVQKQESGRDLCGAMVMVVKLISKVNRESDHRSGISEKSN